MAYCIPGYHGPNVKNISLRMMVDQLLGAQHHTVFACEMAPESGPGHEVQSPIPPTLDAFFFPEDWRGLQEEH